MAKQIKAIKCPHCGSVGKTEVKADHFKCTSCNTEYFLDNDDININHNINYNTPASVNPEQTKKILIFFAIGVFAFVLLTFIIPTIFRSSSSKSNRNTFTSTVTPVFYWRFQDQLPFTNAKGEVLVLVFGEKMYMGDHKDKEGIFASFYDLKSNKELKNVKVENVTAATFNNFQVRQFPNGEIYAIANKTGVFKIDKENLTISDVTQSLFTSHQKLASGIANIEFAYESYGTAFNLMTNEGANYFFYPLEDKIYTKDEVYVAQRALQNQTSNEKLVTKFDFTSLSSDYPEEKVQLIRFTMKDSQGGPDDDTHFSWRNDHFVGKSLTSFGSKFVRSFIDLTPGRLYFKPSILYFDSEYVLISANKTAAEAAPANIQCIDAKTGNLLFTYAWKESQHFNNAIRYKDGFIVKSPTFLLAIGKDGKLIKEFKIN